MARVGVPDSGCACRHASLPPHLHCEKTTCVAESCCCRDSKARFSLCNSPWKSRKQIYAVLTPCWPTGHSRRTSAHFPVQAATRSRASMTKAEQKKAVQFTRMCKFWRTNECKMGADCTFAHQSSELRPSPKPCFEFSKTGSCVRGIACRFVHSVENMKGSQKSKDHAFPGFGQVSRSKPMPSPRQPSLASSSLHPPPGLEGFWSWRAQLPDEDSRRSSFNEILMALEDLALWKETGLEQAHPFDDSSVATQSLTSTMCLSTTPSSFSESDGAEWTVLRL